MDRVLKALFFRPEKVNSTNSAIDELILRISERPDASSYTQVAGGVSLRLERVAQNGGHVSGEVVRQQSENLPAIARANAPLEPNDTPLGHRAAFLYDLSLGVLVIESNRQAASVNRLNSLLRACDGSHLGFHFDPCLNRDVFRKINEGTPRRIAMRFALPNDLSIVESEDDSLSSNIEALRDMVDGGSVNLEIGFSRGDRAGVLSLEGIRNLFRFGGANRSYVEKMSVTIAEEVVPINLFGAQIIETAEISLSSGDIDANYQARREFLCDALARQKAELQSMFGAR